MKRKKILVTATTFPRWEGDSEPGFVFELSNRLAEKYEVTALVPHYKGAKEREQLGNVKVIRFRYFFERWEKLCYEGGIAGNMKKYWYAKFLMPLLIISETVNAIAIARREKIDLMHAHWIVPQGFASAIVKKITGIPYITTAHAGDVFPLKNPLLKLFGKIALKNCAYCTVNSNATKKAVLDVYSPKIEIIPMGVDLTQFSPKKKSHEI